MNYNTNLNLNEKMISLQYEQIDQMLSSPQRVQDDSSARDVPPTIFTTQVASPDGATTRYYTGVDHFVHVNNDKLVTFVMSAGRHDGGTNTMFTIDATKNNRNPFIGIQKSYIDANDISTFTWVSTYTLISIPTDARRSEVVRCYALFSGGSGEGGVGWALLFLFLLSKR